MLFSLIIPVYNVEQYINRCISSCINQQISPSLYEIIVVNDGSTDKSLEILKKIEIKYSNIKVITKTNGGLSSARNAGLKEAKGDYIWFIDSDDWIAPNSLNLLKNVISLKPQIEAITINTILSYDNDTFKAVGTGRKLKNNNIYSGKNIIKKGFVYPFTGAPFYIFKRQFLIDNYLFFKEGVFFEDCHFAPLMLSKLQSCLYLDNILYYYFMRSGSITNSQSSLKKAKDLILISKDLYTNAKESNNIILYTFISQYIGAFYRLWTGLSSKDKCIAKEYFFSEKIWFNSIIKSKKIKYIIYFILLKIRII